MKIVEDYNAQEIQSIIIETASYIGDYEMQLHFNDGTERSVDFKAFLNKSQHPSINKYLDQKLFSKFEIIDGNLNWNDYDLIFPVWDLYNGKIDA